MNDDTDVNQIFIAEEHYILIYPSEAFAALSPGHVSGRRDYDLTIRALHSMAQSLNCKIHMSVPKEPIMLLRKSGIFWNVIVGEKIGWIIVRSWFKVRRLKKQEQNP